MNATKRINDYLKRQDTLIKKQEGLIDEQLNTISHLRSHLIESEKKLSNQKIHVFNDTDQWCADNNHMPQFGLIKDVTPIEITIDNCEEYSYTINTPVPIEDNPPPEKDELKIGSKIYGVILKKTLYSEFGKYEKGTKLFGLEVVSECVLKCTYLNNNNNDIGIKIEDVEIIPYKNPLSKKDGLNAD